MFLSVSRKYCKAVKQSKVFQWNSSRKNYTTEFLKVKGIFSITIQPSA